MEKRFFTTAVIVAAGSSSRMGGADKCFIEVCGIPVIVRAIKAFESSDYIDEIILVTKQSSVDKLKALVKDYGIRKVSRIVIGGDSRQQSVARGVYAADNRTDFFAIHDGARPLVSVETIEKVLTAAYEKGSAIAGNRVKDTIKIVDEQGYILSTPNRSLVWAAATPQAFRADLYKKAVKKAFEEGLEFTDDAHLIEAYGMRVAMIESEYSNIKITTAEDILTAESILNNGNKCKDTGFRVGHGYDVHALAADRKLILGGVEIPHKKGLAGHSDADVLTHAIMDAMLGAACLGDIGRHFPDSQAEYKDISSLELLKRVRSLIDSKGYSVVNIDATVIAEKPKISEYINLMSNNISQACGIDTGCVNIKATTEEGLGFSGRQEGIASHCIVLLKKY